MKTACLIIFLICSVLACSKPDFEIIGNYQTPHYNLFENLAFALKRKKHTIGCSLEVNNDSTFTYKTCGNIISGTWTTKSDSLLLSVISNRWRNDSLAVNGYNGTFPNISTKPIIFRIKNPYLDQELTPIFSNPTIINRLKKDVL